MKIAILTFARTNNYGATLQCYALTKFVEQYGHQVSIINVPLLKAGAPRNKNLIDKVWSKVHNYFHSYEKRYKRTTEQLLQDKELDKQNMKLFDIFRATYFPNLTHEYISESDFENDFPNADLYIVGSDQVWNIWVTNIQYPLFFFSFLKKNEKRISYAACMGGDRNFKFNKEELKTIHSLLEKFDGISVRDTTGLSILKTKFNIPAVQVLDPTFLIDSYDSLLKDSNLDAKGSMFCFKFIINDDWTKVIKHMSDELSLNVRMDTCLIPIDGLPFKPICSVQDWLRLIKTSDFVFTDSFHGMVFCILFKKQFIVTPSYKGGEERYMDLASKLGLADRVYFSPRKIINNTKRWKEKINYEDVYKRLEILRIESKDFLSRYLK